MSNPKRIRFVLALRMMATGNDVAGARKRSVQSGDDCGRIAGRRYVVVRAGNGSPDGGKSECRADGRTHGFALHPYRSQASAQSKSFRARSAPISTRPESRPGASADRSDAATYLLPRHAACPGHPAAGHADRTGHRHPDAHLHAQPVADDGRRPSLMPRASPRDPCHKPGLRVRGSLL